MVYLVQVHFDGDTIADQVSEIWRWIERQEMPTPVLRYRMTAEGITVQIDFNRLIDADAFRHNFGRLMRGMVQVAD